MQSDRNSFCSDLVLDSVIMALRDEDNMTDQISYKQIYFYFYTEDLI